MCENIRTVKYSIRSECLIFKISQYLSRANNGSETLASRDFGSAHLLWDGTAARAQPKPRLHGHFVNVRATWLHVRQNQAAHTRGSRQAAASAAPRFVPARHLCTHSRTSTAVCFNRRRRGSLDFCGTSELTAAATLHVKCANQAWYGASTRWS